MPQQLKLGFECTPVRETFVGPNGPSAAVRIVEMTAELEGVDAGALPPLADAIDPDLINRLIPSDGFGGESPSGLCFTYSGWNVFVRSDGKIIIGDPTETTRPTPLF